MVHISYNIWIVILSFFIAILASYSALNLAGKIYQEQGKTRVAWLFAGSMVMGIGVWSMHFIGMLAMNVNMPMRYNIFLTIISALASIFASYIAFSITIREKVTKWHTALGGITMGSGIIAMHYIGMYAMTAHATVYYQTTLLLASILIALLASYAALYLFRKFRNHALYSNMKLYSALIMGFAICGMHYTGMAALRFSNVHPESLLMNHINHNSRLLVAVTIGTVLIISISLSAFYFERHVLKRMAYTDSLTSLPNRYGLNQFFNSELLAGSVYFIDLDRFKTINDTLGHDIGDKLLQEISVRLSANNKGHVSVFRLGGDEFLIISKTISTKEGAIAFATDILSEIRKPCFIEENELYVTASIGISLAPNHGRERSPLLNAADHAMYQAKQSGESNVMVFTKELGEKLHRRLQLEKDLRKALVHEEFFVVYQPKYDFSSDKLIGMEALIRWQHPEYGLVPPSEFISIAEETGVIIPITDWMLKKVCMQNQTWQLDKLNSDLTVSVNMSARVFESQTLQESVQEALQSSGLHPHLLELEITESIAMNNVNNTVAQLRELQQMGIKVSLDDFGTGYSSLGSLDEMPINIIKIDQSFIKQSNLPAKQAIITSIITIAKNLKMDVIAEGVEESKHIEYLKQAGCSVMQGYYISKPLTAEDMENWLTERRHIS